MPPLNPSSSSSSTASLTHAAAVVPATKAGIRRRKSAAAADTAHNSRRDDSCTILLWKERQKQLQCRLGEVLSGPSRAIAPIAIIGGTFSVYSSAIKISNNNNSANAIQFTPISILYLILLALNYAIMPRLSKRYIHPSTNKQSVALVEEVVKMSLGMGGWILTSYVTASNSNNDISIDTDTLLSNAPITTTSILSQQLQNWSPLSTLVAAGLPSALYALQGILTYTAYQNLDSVTFNGLTQLKVLSTALCCYIVLGKRQSEMQLLSLGMLMASTVVFQGSWKDWLRSIRSKLEHNKNKKHVGGTAITESNGNNRRLLMGVLPCLTATLLSGLAGAFSQRSLQTQVGMMHRNAYFYTVEISFLSAVCLVLSMGVQWLRDGATTRTTTARAEGGDLKKSSSFFQHWTYATLLPITTKATAGLLTALVHRHLGSVIKGFALVLGLVFSALLQFVLEGVDLSGGQLVGTALVLLSSWLHFTNPEKS